MSRAAYTLLKRVIPQTGCRSVELPPNAVLDAPFVDGKPIARWEQLVDAGKRERNFLKISGFHESLGARSVVLGSDSSREEWEAAIYKAVQMAKHSLHVLQVARRQWVPAMYNARGTALHGGRVRCVRIILSMTVRIE